MSNVVQKRFKFLQNVVLTLLMHRHRVQVGFHKDSNQVFGTCDLLPAALLEASLCETTLH